MLCRLANGNCFGNLILGLKLKYAIDVFAGIVGMFKCGNNFKMNVIGY